MHTNTFKRRYYIKRWHFMQRVVMHQLATLPTLAASVLLMIDAGHARHSLALGILMSLLAGILSAWVLLVEIMR